MKRAAETSEEIDSSPFLSNVNPSTSSKARFDRFWPASLKGGFKYDPKILLCIMVILSFTLWRNYRNAAGVTCLGETFILIAVFSFILLIAGAFTYMEALAQVIVTVSLIQTLLILAAAQFMTLDGMVSKIISCGADATFVFAVGCIALYQRKPDDAAPVQQGLP